MYNAYFSIGWIFVGFVMRYSIRGGCFLSFGTKLKSQTARDREIWRFKGEKRLRQKPAPFKPAGVCLGHFFDKFCQNTYFFATFWLFFAIGATILRNNTKISFIFGLFRFDLLARRAIAFTKSRKNARRIGQVHCLFLNKLKIFSRFYAIFRKKILIP